MCLKPHLTVWMSLDEAMKYTSGDCQQWSTKSTIRYWLIGHSVVCVRNCILEKYYQDAGIVWWTLQNRCWLVWRFLIAGWRVHNSWRNIYTPDSKTVNPAPKKANEVNESGKLMDARFFGMHADLLKSAI